MYHATDYWSCATSAELNLPMAQGKWTDELIPFFSPLFVLYLAYITQILYWVQHNSLCWRLQYFSQVNLVFNICDVILQKGKAIILKYKKLTAMLK